MGNFSNIIFLVAEARQPIFSVDLFNSDGTPMDLTAASNAVLRMWLEGATSYTILNAPLTLSGTLNSHMEYLWSNTDTVTPGRYLAEVQIAMSLGALLILPLVGYYHVIIRPIGFSS